MRRVLVVAQVALSLVLLTAAILFTRSLANLKNLNVGFETAQLLKFEVKPLQAGYSQARIKSFGEELRQRLGTVQGVERAALATVPLLQDSTEGGDITVEGAPALSDDERGYDHNSVSPEFFATLKIPVIAGRALLASDPAGMAVVNPDVREAISAGAQSAWGAFRIWQRNGGDGPDDYRCGGGRQAYRAAFEDQPVCLQALPGRGSSFLADVLCAGQGGRPAVAADVRKIVHQVDAEMPVNGLASMSEVIDESLFVEQSLGYLSIGFASLATLLAVVGLYGVMSYSVTSRHRELGIRMAIGATPDRVLTMVLREALLLGVVGALCGIPFLLGASSYIRASLYGVQPNDPVVWGSAVGLLITVALLAGFVPAWQAARIDPHDALRSA